MVTQLTEYGKQLKHILILIKCKVYVTILLLKHSIHNKNGIRMDLVVKVTTNFHPATSHSWVRYIVVLAAVLCGIQ